MSATERWMFCKFIMNRFLLLFKSDIETETAERSITVNTIMFFFKPFLCNDGNDTTVAW